MLFPWWRVGGEGGYRVRRPLASPVASVLSLNGVIFLSLVTAATCLARGLASLAGGGGVVSVWSVYSYIN
jgi:hypothetical protein